MQIDRCVRRVVPKAAITKIGDPESEAPVRFVDLENPQLELSPVSSAIALPGERNRCYGLAASRWSCPHRQRTIEPTNS